MIEVLKYFLSSDLDIEPGSPTHMLFVPLQFDPRRLLLARHADMFLFIASNLGIFMMASVQRSIHQGHEGFSELFMHLQSFETPDPTHTCLWFVQLSTQGWELHSVFLPRCMGQKQTKQTKTKTKNEH